MLVTRIIIDRREYSLPGREDVEAIMGRITAQVRAGGGFVEVIKTPHRAVSVLVSPGTSLSIEVTHVDDDPQRVDFDAETEAMQRSALDPFELM